MGKIKELLTKEQEKARLEARKLFKKRKIVGSKKNSKRILLRK